MDSGTRRIRIVTADDHPIFRDGLRKLLEAAPTFEVIGEASDGHEAIDLVRRLAPDILLLDLLMPRMGGLDALRRLAHDFLAVRTILLAAAVGGPEIVTALQLGARGVVLKSAATQLLYQCIDAVMAGEIWVGRESVTGLVEALRHVQSAPRTPGTPIASLTPRERDIVNAITRGASNRDIARMLSMSEQTVKNHLSSIFSKCGVSNRVELALLAASQNDAGVKE